MEMDLEKVGLDTQQKNFFDENGFIILKDFFPREYVEKIKSSAERIFEIQFNQFGIEGSFTEKMIKLFTEHEEVFINCGKIIQSGLIELYKLPLEEKLLNLIKDIGIGFPNLCTRPVLFFNHPKLAKEEFYYKTPPHQDWSSMQSSLDSLVVWVPLVDVSRENGSILIWPKTHKSGQLEFKSIGGFASVEASGEYVQPKMSVGDIAIFSTFLVHSSGEIYDNSIRWSCHYRYTNMLDEDFINRGFPNPYIYKPVTK